MPTDFIEHVNKVQEFIRTYIDRIGLGNDLSGLLTSLIAFVILVIISWAFYKICTKVFRLIVKPWIYNFDHKDADIFLKKGTLKALALLVSGILFYNLLPVFFEETGKGVHALKILTGIWIVASFLMLVTRILHSIEYLGHRSEKFEKKPISSYIQVALILVYIFCAVLVVSILIGQSPMTIITAFGAGMAIFMLVFKDLILGLVASVQVSVNDMVRVGDWIIVHDYQADGEVEAINLTTVKVRNWDKTIANVPTYALVSQGFDNVRERDDTKMRRFKHHLLIDVRTIKAVDEAFINRLQRKNLLAEDPKNLTWSGEKNYDFKQVTTVTNLSLFRQYVEAYLFKHPGIDNSYMVVRQLQQEGEGHPLEIYAFVRSVSFKPLNFIMSDIFEHLYAIIAEFDLILYQKPSGKDLLEINAYPGKKQVTRKDL